MKTIVKTDNLDFYPEEWVDEIIDQLPEDVATWCFSNAPTWHQTELSNHECHAALLKLWQEIPVIIVSSDMSGQTIRQIFGKFIIPPSNGHNDHYPTPGHECDNILMNKLLTDIGSYTDGSFWPDCIAAVREGHRIWLTYNKYSVYTREFPYLKAYERNGTHPRIFVWADKIIKDYPKAYNYVLATTILCSKIEALMDFDLSGNCYKIERSYSMLPCMEEYFRLKSIGLSFGWALYLMSLKFPHITKHSFYEPLSNCDIAHRIGKYYAMPEPHYLFEGTRVWMETKRRLCFGPVNTCSIGNSLKQLFDLTSVAQEWTDMVYDCDGKIGKIITKLLSQDYCCNDVAAMVRDERNGGFNKLSVINIPSDVVELRDYTFRESKCMIIYLHPGIRHIDFDAFDNCDASIHEPDEQ